MAIKIRNEWSLSIKMSLDNNKVQLTIMSIQLAFNNVLEMKRFRWISCSNVLSWTLEVYLDLTLLFWPCLATRRLTLVWFLTNWRPCSLDIICALCISIICHLVTLDSLRHNIISIKHQIFKIKKVNSLKIDQAETWILPMRRRDV